MCYVRIVVPHGGDPKGGAIQVSPKVGGSRVGLVSALNPHP